MNVATKLMLEQMKKDIEELKRRVKAMEEFKEDVEEHALAQCENRAARPRERRETLTLEKRKSG